MSRPNDGVNTAAAQRGGGEAPAASPLEKTGQGSAHAAPPLPPIPFLDEKHLRSERVAASGLGDVEFFVPAEAPYTCDRAAAPALVLVPGLGMDAAGFLRQLPLGVLAHLYLFQTPNEPVRGEEGLGAYARYIEEFIRAQKLEEQPGGVVLGGCSMGGALSLAVAIRGKVKLRGLLLMGTFGACRHLPRWQRLAAPLAWVVPFALVRRIAWHMVARSSFFGSVTPAEADWLVSCKLKRTQTYFGSAVAMLTRQNQISAAGRIGVPTLVLHGTRDRVLPYAAGEELARAIPTARLVPVEDAGHALFFTHHQPVNAAIAEFLGQLSGDQAIG
jgi:3-oxoadipate enol-lactonase/4-carboxymuconolactone decarboxylase